MTYVCINSHFRKQFDVLRQVVEERLITTTQSVLLAENKLATQPAVSITEVKITWVGALHSDFGGAHRLFFSDWTRISNV